MPIDLDFPDEDIMTTVEDNPYNWRLYFDMVGNATSSGIGAVLVSPKRKQIPIVVKLNFDYIKNMMEYEACIVGLQVDLEFGFYELDVYGDSLLIVLQTHEVPAICQPVDS